VFDASLAYEVLPKAVFYAAVLLVIGAAVAAVLLASASADWPAHRATVFHNRLNSLRTFAAALVLAALVGRAVGHTALVFEAVSWVNMRVITLESQWGAAWRIQALAAFATLVVAVTVQILDVRRNVWLLVMAAVLCGTVPLLGHAAGSWSHWAVHAAHLAGGGLWLGTLAAIVVITRSDDPGDALTAALVARFSPVALICGTVVVATGLISATLYLGAFANLAATPYGRVLLGKLMAVAAVGACGWSNWQRARAAAPPRLGVMAAELFFAGLVVLLTSVLTEIEHP
jgi:putative copper resistance protein D